MSQLEKAKPDTADFITGITSEIRERESGLVTVHLLRDVVEGVDAYAKAHNVSRDVAIGELLRGALGLAA